MSISDPQPKLSFKQAAIVSGLVNERQYEKGVDTAGSDDPNMVAAALVKSGLITEYQAQQLNVGHTKFTLGEALFWSMGPLGAESPAGITEQMAWMSADNTALWQGLYEQCDAYGGCSTDAASYPPMWTTRMWQTNYTMISTVEVLTPHGFDRARYS